MKIVKGVEWLKRDFMEQLERLLTSNHVIELNGLVKFEDKERFIENMLIRKEIEVATKDDIEYQAKMDCLKETLALQDEQHKNKLEEEEAALKAAMGI